MLAKPMHWIPRNLTVLILAVKLTACANLDPQISNTGSDSNSNLPSEPNSETAEANTTTSKPTQPSNSETSNPTKTLPTSIEIETFTVDELLEAGGGGCGMSLWKPGHSPWEDGIYFFHGLEDESALMRIDGRMVQLTRTAASGEDFYGQRTSQTFETSDGLIKVLIDVTLGLPGEIESVEISEGLIQISKEGQNAELSVIGDAGC